MKKIFTCLVTYMCFAKAYTQTPAVIKQDNATTAARSAAFIEAGGLALSGATINYERHITKTPGGLAAHVGFGGGYIHYTYNNTTTLHTLLTSGLSYSIAVSSNKLHFVELEFNYSIIINGPGCGCIESPIVGYRYISPLGKLLLRATLMPVVFLPGTFSHTFSWAGFSIGRTF